MKTATQKERTIQSLDRAVAILHALAAAPEGTSLKALADQLRLAPQTLQSLLRTLQAHGLAVQEQRGAPYRLGPAVLTLAQNYLSSQGLAAAAGPIVKSLAEATGEYVLLAEWQGLKLMAMAEARPQQPLMVGRVAFRQEQFHTMATGKLLLAYLEPQTLAQVMKHLKFGGPGRHAARDPEHLHQQLAQVRETKQALCIDERADHVAALAVPVRDAGSSVRAALGIYLPMARYSPTKGETLLNTMRKAAREIEKAWGFP